MNSRGKAGFGFLKRAVASALGVLLGSYLIDGITYEDNFTLVVVVLILGLLNAFLKPLLILATLPFVLMTLGTGILIINAALYLLAAKLIDGFAIATFWDAFWGALVISICGFVLKFWTDPGNGGVTIYRARGNRGSKAGKGRRNLSSKDDVIDI